MSGVFRFFFLVSCLDFPLRWFIPGMAFPSSHATPAGTDGVSPRRGTIVALAVLIAISALAIDLSMPVLAVVARDLGVSANQAPLLIGLYLAGYALGQIPLGLLSDRYGRLPVIFGGLSVFVVAALVTSITNTMWILIAARFVQGIGGAVGPVLARAVIRDLTSGTKAAHLLGLMVMILGISTICAPLVGGALMTMFGWRSTFSAAVPLGLVCVWLVHRYVPETLVKRHVPQTAAEQLTDSFHAFFTRHQCLWGMAIVGLAFSGYMTAVSHFSSALVDGFGLDAIWVGPFFSCAGGAYFLGAGLSRHFVVRQGSHAMLKWAMFPFAFACVVLLLFSFLGGAQLGLVNGLLMLWLGIILYCIGVGMMLPNATAIAMELIPHVAGFAASILGTVQMGMAVLASTFATGLPVASELSMTIVMAVTSGLTVLIFLLGKAKS